MKVYFDHNELGALRLVCDAHKLKLYYAEQKNGGYAASITHENGDDLYASFAFLIGREFESYRDLESIGQKIEDIKTIINR